MKDIVIIYHYPCLDGFGGAYAAWKKFGDRAEYRGMRRSSPVPTDLAGKEVYFIDFTYPQDITDQIKAAAKSVTVLDHHIGVKEVVESVPNHVFDNDASGATIAWRYFHPALPVPRMFAYLEDIDLWLNALPSTKEVALFLSTEPFDFDVWEHLVAKFEDEGGFREIQAIGAHYSRYHDEMMERFVSEAFKVKFEDYKVEAANVPNFFASSVANRLYERGGLPFAITWHVERSGIHVSLRGDGSVDLAELARRHGGNGHRGAAGFRLPADAPLPFVRI
jgi:oligoribonuclease NrnB/cAMP/cGMP phosphodiesterase (DHH superfamily)